MVWWVYGRLIKEDFAIRVFGKKKVKRERNRKQNTTPKTNSLSLNKLAVGKLLSSLGRSIFRCCVGFRECKGWSINPVLLVFSTVSSKPINHTPDSEYPKPARKLKNLFLYQHWGEKMNFQIFRMPHALGLEQTNSSDSMCFDRR